MTFFIWSIWKQLVYALREASKLFHTPGLLLWIICLMPWLLSQIQIGNLTQFMLDMLCSKQHFTDYMYNVWKIVFAHWDSFGSLIFKNLIIWHLLCQMQALTFLDERNLILHFRPSFVPPLLIRVHLCVRYFFELQLGLQQHNCICVCNARITNILKRIRRANRRRIGENFRWIRKTLHLLHSWFFFSLSISFWSATLSVRSFILLS